MTIDRHSWSYRKEAEQIDYLSSAELIALLVDTVR